MTSVVQDGLCINDASGIANGFSEHFSSVCFDTSSSPYSCTIPRYPNSFFLYPTFPEEVQSVITNLRATGPGLDNINGAVIKSISPLIATVFSHMFNLIFKTGVFPQQFKEANVLPVFNKGDCKLVENYRPISVLPFLDKILEKVIEIRLSKYLTKFHILSDSQFGFREGLSTNIAIANFTDTIKRCIDNAIYAGTIFVDFARAFDSIDHNILLIKLECYGITGPALNILRSFLNHRKQCISINDANSDPITIECGVPQGSIFGPILFLIFINDLPPVSIFFTVHIICG